MNALPKALLTPRLQPITRIAIGSLTVSKMQSALPLDEAAEVLAYAFDSGINLVDTAQYYENYDIIRLALKKCKAPENVILSTKTYAYSRELAIQAVEEARRETDRDVIELFMLHEQESYDTLRGHREALDYLFECRERGIIRAVGASTHHVALVKGLLRLIDDGYTPDVCHPLYNKEGIGIADGSESDMADILTTAHERGIGIFAMKALGGGHLCGTAEDALRYVLDKPFIDAAAVGMQSFDEVDANLRFLRNGSFSAEDKKRLATKHRSLHVEEYCEGCGSCVRRCSEGALHLEAVSNDDPSAQYDFSAQFLHDSSTEMQASEKMQATTKMRAVADDTKCVRCGYCTKVCPVFALKVY